MIRRPHVSADGAARWVLISQIEHARISGELAERWNGRDFAAPAWQDELLPAIFHHDDGWAEWEASPDVDPQSGVPLDFTEMPLRDSLVIWRASIASAERFGPLAAYVVAAHFTALLRRGAEAKEHPPAWSDLAAEFLAEQDESQAGRLSAWQRGGEGRDAAAATTALRWLKFFDALSLWLCCGERGEPLDLCPPLGPAVTFAPRGSATEVSPWPFAAGKLLLAVPGRSIPRARYADRAALASAEAVQVTVPWRIVPAAPP